MVSPLGIARSSVAVEAPVDAIDVDSPAVGAASLDELAVGDRATVRRLANERPVARRLMELGLLPGTEVEVVRVAPLGDPIELGLRGYRLSIRRSEAARIEVAPGRGEDR